MERLPLETQTLYAELLEQLTALDAHRSIGRVPGCFVTKIVKGDTYYYFQYSDPGGVLRQRYVGKRTPALDKIVARFQEERGGRETDVAQIQRLCAQLRAGGALTADSAIARVIKALAESGLFYLGGVLVGTHAFAVLGNLLGIRWTQHAVKTQDIDIAGRLHLDIAVPDLHADVPQILDALQMGFLPVPAFNLKSPSTSFKVRGAALRVDFLTPLKHPRSTAPVVIHRFNMAAQPLPYLDYLLEHYERGALVNGQGVLVNVPTPARFAFHKLIVSRARDISTKTKSDKDLLQAGQVLEALAEDRPGDLLLAWEALESRGKAWIEKAVSGLSALIKRHPTVKQPLLDALPSLHSHLKRLG
ncbi:MAG: GSU2403 family nucleotidyltransferase fold protein [Nitrospiraceae bacterium]